MPERTAAGGGAELPARTDLTVRDAILAAAEQISDVPIPRSPAADGPGVDGRRPGEAVRSHG
jgi:hypothetical protein